MPTKPDPDDAEDPAAEAEPKSPDAAEALAIAITHAHHRASTALRLKVVGL
jgi:crossover junction endodeoxyribonuclease RuvC